MDLIPTQDMGWVVLFVMTSFWITILSSPLIVLAEAVVLYRIILKENFWRSLRDSFVINLISTLLGLVWWTILTPTIVGFAEFASKVTGTGYSLSDDYYTALSGSTLSIFLFCVLFSLWAPSVIVEGIALMILERQHAVRRVWLASLVANVASYVGLFLILSIAQRG